MSLVFVYGSLKRGCRHHAHLGGARLLRAATCPGYRLVRHGEYPALVQGAGQVAGELYEVDDWLLERLDRFEDCPELYQREVVRLASGEKAFAYTMSVSAVEGDAEIPDGRWVEEEELAGPGGDPSSMK